MESSEHSRSLPVPLTDTEKEVRTQDLIRRLDIIEDIEERRKASNDEYKSQIKREVVNCSQLRRDLKQGFTMEEIKCGDIMDWENGTVQTVRFDTQETVSEREITASERQMRLDEQSETETQEAEATKEKEEESEQQIFTQDKTGEKKDGPENDT